MAEITVIGAGISGLTIAYACASRGAAVRVLEKREIGAGSSGGVLGALAPHTPERWEPKKEFQLDSLLMAAQFWADVDRTSGQTSGYGRVGRLQPIANEHQLELAHTRARDVKTLWRGQADWHVVRQADFAPWAPASATGYLVRDDLSARIHPRHALHSLAGAVRALGGEVCENIAEPARFAVGKTVWATGYEGLLALGEVLGETVGNGVKGQAALLDHDARGLPQLYGAGIHVVPHADGSVGIGATSERYFDAPTTIDDQLDALLARARAAFPVLARARVLERWAGVRPRGATRAPMLGPWPSRAGQFIANGGFKIGIGMAPKLAGIMADLLLDGRDEIPDEFRVEANLPGVQS